MTCRECGFEGDNRYGGLCFTCWLDVQLYKPGQPGSRMELDDLDANAMSERDDAGLE